MLKYYPRGGDIEVALKLERLEHRTSHDDRDIQGYVQEDPREAVIGRH